MDEEEQKQLYPDSHTLGQGKPEWQFGQVGTRGSEVVETINEAVLDNTWRKLPEDIRNAIKLGAQIGWDSGSTMPDGSPNPIQVQDLEPILNLSPQVLSYKAIRSGISRGLGFDPRLVDQAALTTGGANLLKKGINKVSPKLGLTPNVLKTKPTSNVIDMSNKLDDWLSNPQYSKFKQIPAESSISVVKPGSLFAKDYKGVLTKPQPYAYAATAKPKVSTNEKVKQSLIANDVIELPPTYKGGPVTFREEADFFDVSAALIGGGLEDTVDASGKKIDYNRDAVTKFHTKSEKKDIIFNHIKDRLRGTTITREEFNEYAKEQIAAEKDLRKAIKLLNLRSYASQKGIDLSKYPTIDSQLELLNNINKAKRPPHRKKGKDTGEFTEGLETFEARKKIWEMDTDRFQQYADYKETFDYGHIISAKTGFRLEDLGMNRISNTEIEVAHNVVSRDPYTQKIIEILQEGNRERGSRRDYHPAIQRMRNTAGSVVEDFIKWKANKDGDPVNLTKILDKFIPRDQHDNYLQFIQKKFYEKRLLGYATKKEFVEEVYGFPYKLYENIPNSQKVKINKEFIDQRDEMGSIIGRQQYDQAGEWMLEAIDEFINLHHFSKPKKLYSTKESKALQDIGDEGKLTIDDLMKKILPDR